MRTYAGGGAAVETLQPGLGLRARLGFRSFSWGATCLVLDATMLLLAAGAAGIGARFAPAPTVPPLATAAFVGLSLALLYAHGLYVPRLKLDVLDDAKAATIQVSVAGMAVLTAVAVAGEDIGGVLRLWAFSAIYLVGGRAALYASQTRARRNGEAVSPTLVVGSGHVGRHIARRLLEHRDLGLLPVGFVDPHAKAQASRDGELPIPVLGATDDLDRIAAVYDISQVVVNCAGGLVDEDLIPMLDRCQELGLSVAFVPGAHEKITSRLRVEHVGGLPLITAHATDPRGWQFAVKYALDRVVAAVLVLLASPVLLAAALAVLVSMGRPVFYRQVRIGRDGTEFEMLKFRSMREGRTTFEPAFVAHGMGPGGVEGDDRRTRVGAFLRTSSLDELPQLLNVLKGEMSLVGPRPERPEYVDEFVRTTYRYSGRHRAKSGITGWAQVHGLRGRTSIADRAEWDNWYIENFSLWLDLKILLLTVVAVTRFFKRGE